MNCGNAAASCAWRYCIFAWREIKNRKSIFPLHPTGESLPKSGISPRSRTGSDVESELPLAEPLSSLVLVLPELPELLELPPVDPTGAVVASGVDPKPLCPTADA